MARNLTARPSAFLLWPVVAMWPVAALAARDTTLVISAPAPVQIGAQASIGVTVSYVTTVTAAIYPGGTVDFTSNGAALAGCTGLSLKPSTGYGVSTVSCNTAFSQAGSFAIQAVYSGDSNSNPSSGSANVTILSPTSITLAVKNGYQQVGQLLTIAATVSNSGNLSASGAIGFTSNGSAIAGCMNDPLGAGSVATCITSFPQTGTFTIGAAYAGDSANNPSTGSMQLIIGKAYAVPYIASYVLGGQSNGQYYASQSVTIGAKFAQAPSVAPPSGTAAFYKGSTLLATVAVSASSCDLPGYACANIVAPGDVSGFAPGNYSITAVYSGDANYQSATTSPLPIAITKTPTTPYITANPDGAKAPLVVGQPLTLGAQFPPPPGSVLVPSGTITFYDGATALAAVSIDPNGHALVSMPSAAASALSAGSHSFKAVYGGDANYQSSDTSTMPGGILNITVNKAPVSLVLAASPFQPGQPFSITAIPIVSSPGILPAQGTFDFSAASAPIAACSGLTVASSGSAAQGYVQCTATLSEAASITVTYNGDAGTSGASASVVLVAGKAFPGIYAESVDSTPVLGQSLTVDVRLVGVAGFAAPTGSVTFTDGSSSGATVGNAAVGTDGHAILVVPAGVRSLGGHNITAAYSGDTNYTSGTALPVPITVKPDPTILVVASGPAQLGQPLSVNLAVAAISPGTAVPTGPIQVYGNGGSLAAACNPSQQNGVAQCTARITSLDTLSPAVAYVGDAGTASTTAAPALPAAQSLAGIYLNTSTPNPPVGTAATITAVLIGAPGISGPSGSVVFQDNGAALATVPVALNGQAVLTVPSTGGGFTVGGHLVTALYSGDLNYLPSSVPASINIVVTKAMAKMDLCSLVPRIGCSTGVQAGQPATLQANVTILGPGTPATTGSVDFSSTGNAIAGCTGVPVQNGIAQCNAAFPQPGAYTITASYSGGPATTAVTAVMQLTVGKMVPGLYLSAYSDTLPYGAGAGIRALLMGTPMPAGTVTFSDGASTLATVAVGTDGTASLSIPSGALAPLSVGTHSLSASFSGDSNYQAAKVSALTLTITKAATTVALYAAPPQIDQPVTLKASVTVVSPGVATPSGTVDFTSGGAGIKGCMGLALQNGAVTCATSFSQLGVLAITATYNGDAQTAANTAIMQLTAGKAVAGIYLASSPTAPVFGVPVTLGALLLGAAGLPAPTGTVIFSDGSAVLGTGAVGSNGHASLNLATGALAAGPHVLTASYGGDANYAGATVASMPLTVAKALTTTTLTAGFESPLTATVNVVAPGAGSPTGTVQFFAGGAQVGAAPLSGKSGSYTATITAGSWSGSASAIYLGDANFTGSTSPSVSLAAAAVVTIACDHNPATAGQPVVVAVLVAPASGNKTPTGSVQLTVDGSAFGSAALSSGTASFSVPSSILPLGSHSIGAAYSGDGIYPAVSATINEVVTKLVASLALTTSPANSVYGQPVTFTAQLADGSGTVQFYDGAAAIGSAALASGEANLTVSTLAAGTHSISAAWAGDSGAANSAPLSFAVAKAQTTTILSSIGATVAASVAAIAPGAGTPSGTVEFLDGSTNSVFASPALVGGRAIAVQPATTDPIVAVYSGDANFAGSASAGLTPLAAINAASFAGDSLAADEIVTLFGANLSITTAAATSNPTTSLGGATATVTDSAGVRYTANLLFVSPTQASLVIPGATPLGPAVIAITNGAGTTLTTAVNITAIDPGLFTADGSGRGAAVGQTIRVHSDGSQDAPQDLAAGPIDLGDPADAVYLVLYGTGIRHQTASSATFTCGSCTSGDLPLAFAGAQPSVAGLDQVNLLLPRWLRGVGQVSLALTADGITSNAVTLTFR